MAESSDRESVSKYHASEQNTSSEKQPNNELDEHNLLQYVVPYGVKRAEVISDQYRNRMGKTVVFLSIFLVAYAYGLDGTVRSTYQTMATSSYSSHSLLATINTVRSVFAAASLPFIAKLADVFGRLEILLLSVLFYSIGTIIESQAINVQRFAAGALFYQFGYSGTIVVLQMMAADFSFLNWRVFASFVPALPFIINTWISGDVTSAVGTRWSWGIGMWAFIFPLACVPLLLAYSHMYYLAKSKGLLNSIQERKYNAKEHLVNVFWTMDLIGVILFAASLSLFLIPFTLAGGVSTLWQKAHIIVPLVFGFVLFPVFIIWELYIQKHYTNVSSLLPLHMIRDRGVWSALMIGIFIDWIWYMQGDYLYTVLIVGVGESIKSATRISSLYSFVSVVTGFFYGLFIVKFRRLKGFIIFGISLWFVSFGLLVHYRGGDYSHAGIIGAQCLLGFGAAFFTYPTQTSIQTCTNHIYMGVALSIYLSSYYVGSAFGSTISGAIWSQKLPQELIKHMGDDSLAAVAYGDPLDFATKYALGTPERDAVIVSYQYIQKILCVVGLCLCVPLLAFGLLLRDRELLANKQSYDTPAVEDELKTDIPNDRMANRVRATIAFKFR
ncbi:MFS general substrate transporter [Dipodascopsis uninucleata]